LISRIEGRCPIEVVTLGKSDGVATFLNRKDLYVLGRSLTNFTCRPICGPKRTLFKSRVKGSFDPPFDAYTPFPQNPPSAVARRSSSLLV
jgi:hypothetical protein